MIKVEIKYEDISELKYAEQHFYNVWICEKLKDAGVPIIGGPLLPKVDFSKGIVETYDDIKTRSKVYIWKPYIEQTI